MRPPIGVAEGAYGWPFWLTYAANCSLMTAISLLFRYADFVTLLGGTEWHLGWIVGVGMVGSLAMRLFQGVGIDRYGSRQVWIWSEVGFVIACLAHLAIRRVDGPAIFLLRVLFNTSLAGVFGASITYISRRAPVFRLAEVVGTLGTSGFIGMMAGTALGDWLGGRGPLDRPHIDRLFLVAALLGCCSFVCACLATRGAVRPVKRHKPHLAWLVRRYHPGGILLMSLAMGFGLGLPGIFLRPYAKDLGIAGIAAFFWVYCPMAFITRLLSRRMPERAGIRAMLLWGQASLACGMLAFLLVNSWWHLALPAAFIGISHALLFPAVVAGGNARFPTRHRGLGTTLTLAMMDLGNLFGAPIVGGLLHYSGRAHLPRYPTMFLTVASLLALATGVYLLVDRRAASASDEGSPRAKRETAEPSAIFPAG